MINLSIHLLVDLFIILSVQKIPQLNNPTNLDTKGLLNEVKIDYGRAVNQVTFDIITSDAEQTELMGISVPPQKPPKPVPE